MLWDRVTMRIFPAFVTMERSEQNHRSQDFCTCSVEMLSLETTPLASSPQEPSLTSLLKAVIVTPMILCHLHSTL